MIRWQYLSRAFTYYSFIYKPIEVPWIVSEKAIRATLPPEKIPFQTSGGYLVGSAEQSFIELTLTGNLNCGKYVACSPCFRDEQEDDLHQKTFMKVELFHRFSSRPSDNNIQNNIANMIADAKCCFKALNAKLDNNIIKTLKTDEGFDLEINGIEVGSYGYREFDDIYWVYGTGLAEPRFSIALKEK